jgi:hypothetical protein
MVPEQTRSIAAASAAMSSHNGESSAGMVAMIGVEMVAGLTNATEELTVIIVASGAIRGSLRPSGCVFTSGAFSLAGDRFPVRHVKNIFPTTKNQ